ncbi:MAG: hypothetical protein OXH50_15490 [Gemmatimonadetes bacterium]|nr:hypothetical protein [Gemmatimonadota bacterium]
MIWPALSALGILVVLAIRRFRDDWRMHRLLTRSMDRPAGGRGHF